MQGVSPGAGPQHPMMPPEDLNGDIALLPMDGVVIFPQMIAPLVIADERARPLVEAVMRGDRMLAVFHPLPPEEAPAEEGAPAPKLSRSKAVPQLHRTGTLCSVLRMLRVPDGSLRLLLHGICRVEIKELAHQDPYLRGTLEVIREQETRHEDLEIEAMMKLTLENLQRAINFNALPEELVVAAMNTDGPARLADLVAANLPVRAIDLLPILAEYGAKERLRAVQMLLGREVHVLEIGNRINDEVREEVDRNQRTFYLNQQLKAIRRELGEADPHEAELEELQKRIREADMPDHARSVAEKELGRLMNLPTAAAEYGVIRTYLEWILDIPWGTTSDDRIDIQRARTILDEDHYGLEKVKERILEFLSVIRLKNGDLKGPILCLVGPPGVGKTSLGRSVARATGRKFQNFSLGGMRDEAEIRGHRRTYVGAMPGRIIKCLKESGTMNPLIMLDEIDKLGSDFRGDPASALLEVLDPEQNSHFNDHYMDMPVDLSRVMFITTANTLDSIPEPLRDRMEIIRIAGYTELEKQEIAARYLVPREIDNAGLKRKDLVFQKAALRSLIREYTSEAGVRGLQREIGKVCRKVAMRVAEYTSYVERQKDSTDSKPPAKGAKKKPPAKEATPKAPEKVTVTAKNLEEFLGPKRSFQEVAERVNRPGIVTGLAWTSVGGAILFIEAARFPGKGQLKLTGQLGDVMKESAEAALSYLRSNADQLDFPVDAFSAYDYHVHVPAGATPKDGPSAGTAMAVALASLITGRAVRDFVAMTGEITLRGNVLPVGGIKEKCLAAHRAGVKEIFLPHHNEADYGEVPDLVRKGIKVHFFKDVKEYINAALRR